MHLPTNWKVLICRFLAWWNLPGIPNSSPRVVASAWPFCLTNLYPVHFSGVIIRISKNWRIKYMKQIITKPYKHRNTLLPPLSTPPHSNFDYASFSIQISIYRHVLRLPFLTRNGFWNMFYIELHLEIAFVNLGRGCLGIIILIWAVVAQLGI